MKILAVIGNIFLLLSIFGIASEEGVTGSEWWGVSLIAAIPVLNLYLIRSVSGRDWISLWLQRKALEEKKKIEKLSDNKS